MIDYLNAVAEIAKERRKYFRDYKHYARLITGAVNLEDVEVIVFGSILKGDYTVGSDIDVLIVSDSIPKGLNERARILCKINDVLGYPHPFELHLVTKKEAERYKRSIGDYVKV